MLMMLGITTLGAAILNKHLANPAGVGCIAVGLSGAAYLRGHLVAIAAVALAVAQMWPSRGRGTVRTVITLVLAIGCLTYASSAVTSKFGGDDAAERDDSVSSILSFANNQTAQGGSNFKPVAVTNPTTLPLGIVTVLFRPLPLIDARSGRQFIGALEAMILLVLTYRSRRSLFASFRQFGRSVHVRFATTYTLAFVIPFSYIANFGILARQRTQVLPLFFILLALLPDLAPDGVDVPSEKSDLRATSGTTTADPRTPVLRRYRYPTRL